MPLEILAPMVILGIALAVLLVQFSGLSKSAKLTDRSHAAELLKLDYPEERIDQIYLQANGKSALAAFSGGSIGTVSVMGSKFLTRKYTKGDILSVERDADQQVRARFRDFTHPSQSFRSKDPAELDSVETWLRNLIKS